jgi:undecaprenyl-phosphate galactose phosphotransferase
MVPDAEALLKKYLEGDAGARAEWERDFKLKDDPRITPIGAFLRRTSLDELPQLWNVLKGEMSLVGPRPIIEEELARYGDQVDYYLETRPGITGLWQISGRNDTTYEDRVALDCWYVRNWSLWYDLVILVKTTAVVLRSKGAY